MKVHVEAWVELDPEAPGEPADRVRVLARGVEGAGDPGEVEVQALVVVEEADG